jgi:hypothetical protein
MVASKRPSPRTKLVVSEVVDEGTKILGDKQEPLPNGHGS